MDDLPLSGLPPGDPRNRLSTEARQRVLRAHIESETIRWQAEADVEAPYGQEIRRDWKAEACSHDKSLRIAWQPR